MRTTILGLALVAVAGCAHAPGDHGEARDLRGSARVGADARVLMTGPAADVHTDVQGNGGVAFYVVERVKGDDRDCAGRASPDLATSIQAESSRGHWQLPVGSALCASSPGGSTEVLWHARVGGPRSLWALR